MECAPRCLGRAGRAGGAGEAGGADRAGGATQHSKFQIPNSEFQGAAHRSASCSGSRRRGRGRPAAAARAGDRDGQAPRVQKSGIGGRRRHHGRADGDGRRRLGRGRTLPRQHPGDRRPVAAAPAHRVSRHPRVELFRTRSEGSRQPPAREPPDGARRFRDRRLPARGADAWCRRLAAGGESDAVGARAVAARSDAARQRADMPGARDPSRRTRPASRRSRGAPDVSVGDRQVPCGGGARSGLVRSLSRHHANCGLRSRRRGSGRRRDRRSRKARLHVGTPRAGAAGRRLHAAGGPPAPPGACLVRRSTHAGAGERPRRLRPMRRLIRSDRRLRSCRGQSRILQAADRSH